MPQDQIEARGVVPMLRHVPRHVAMRAARQVAAAAKGAAVVCVTQLHPLSALTGLATDCGAAAVGRREARRSHVGVAHARRGVRRQVLLENGEFGPKHAPHLWWRARL